MRDPFEESVGGLGKPREPDPGFRERLEEAILGESSGDPVVGRWRIDGPRELAPVYRARLEAGLTSPRRRSPSLVRFIAAAVVMMVAAAATVVVVDRLGTPTPRIAVGPILTPTPISTASTPVPATARPKGSLQAFASRSAFLSYVRDEGVKLADPMGVMYSGSYTGSGTGGSAPPLAVPGGQPAPAHGQPMALPAAGVAPSYSTTNIQEAGVDEPDIVKTDGRKLIVLSVTDLRVLDVTNGRARLRGTLRILNGVGLFLTGDKVILFTSLYQAPPEAVRATHAVDRPWTKVNVIDVANLDHPKVVSSMSIEGSFVGARLARGVVRLIVQSGALGPAPVYATQGTKSEIARVRARNLAAIRRSSVGDWVPHYVVRRGARTISTGHVHNWTAVSRPPDKAGLSMLTLLTIDPDDPRPDNASSVIGAGDVIYSSLDNLYVTSGRIADVISLRSGRAPRSPITRIHKFDIRDPRRATYRGSGVVPGLLLNQFSLSELDGYLRVATTLDPPWAPSGRAVSTSSVFVMKERAGKLVIAGSIGKLGVGERIYSVRFLGSKGYVVTFRQVDPLYVIDLRVPTRPRLAGKLKVPGYSGYLHPISETLLLGIGQEADSNGRVGGLKISMFNVADPKHPTEVDSLVAGTYGSSEAATDHHALLYWEPTRLLVVPVALNDESYRSTFIGALATHIARSGALAKPIRISHAGRPNTENTDVGVRRCLVIGSRVITISAAGVLMSDLDTLHTRTWIPFQA